MSLEAALVFPVIIFGLFFALSMMLYQYNRCIQGQRLSVLVLEAAISPAEKPREREAYLASYYSSMGRGAYVAFAEETPALSWNRSRWAAKGGTRQGSFPWGAEFLGLGAYGAWALEERAAAHLYQPSRWMHLGIAWMEESEE